MSYTAYGVAPDHPFPWIAFAQPRNLHTTSSLRALQTMLLPHSNFGRNHYLLYRVADTNRMRKPWLALPNTLETRSVVIATLWTGYRYCRKYRSVRSINIGPYRRGVEDLSYLSSQNVRIILFEGRIKFFRGQYHNTRKTHKRFVVVIETLVYQSQSNFKVY